MHHRRVNERGPTSFGTLLRAWRGRRGLSQLDLALAAEVSTRHLSFLETGRSQPSADMVARLAEVLGVGLRDQNDLLLAARLPRRFPESRGIPTDVETALTQMLAQHEPYPLVVLDSSYEVLRANGGTEQMMAALSVAPPAEANLLELLFDPRGLRPFVLGWPELAQRLLARVRRELLVAPGETRLAALLDRLLAFPEVSRFTFDPALRAEAVVPLRLAAPDAVLSFVTTTTTFSVPHDVGVSELRIESLFPLDDVTRAFFGTTTTG